MTKELTLTMYGYISGRKSRPIQHSIAQCLNCGASFDVNEDIAGELRRTVCKGRYTVLNFLDKFHCCDNSNTYWIKLKENTYWIKLKEEEDKANALEK